MIQPFATCRALALGAMVLAGCSGSSANVETPDNALDTLRGAFANLSAGGRPAGDPAAALTAGNLRAAGLDGDVLGLVLEERGLAAAMTPAVVSGRTIAWETADGVTVSTRNGALAATRGLGQDVLDAVTAPLEAALAAGRPADYVRGITILDGGNAPYVIGMRCALRGGGADAGLGVPARTWTETCELSRPDGSEVVPATIRNAFVTAGGAVLVSRQWAGPRTGMLTFRRFRI
ncbi:MAG: YjbF family lipoprotein [Hasllibacter sp.]